jgi:hypothetical protein
MNLFHIDESTCRDLFLLCNEYASKLTVMDRLDCAQILIEQALLLYKQIPS